MSDSDEKYLELMHAEIDGVASGTERAALREYLGSHPEAQIAHTELVKLTGILNRVEAVKTPDDLHESILAALPRERVENEMGARNSGWRFRIPLIRYGYALAAGILLGAALTGVAIKNMSPLEKPDVYGTMAVRETAPRCIAVDQMKLDRPELGGSVELCRSASDTMIIFDLQGDQAVDVEVGFDGSQGSLKSFDLQPSGVASFAAQKGTISFRSEGKQRSTIVLTSQKNVVLIPDVRMYVGGKLMQQGTLGARGAGGSTK
ncbi:MAG TPA: hypothetical protein VKP58_13775 [Candidatus Acidoferrum sp.]|nr:hypothetical protein [Candidatus Acidoferrum sp.]